MNIAYVLSIRRLCTVGMETFERSTQNNFSSFSRSTKRDTLVPASPRTRSETSDKLSAETSSLFTRLIISPDCKPFFPHCYRETQK